MKLTRLVVAGLWQFRELDIDLTNPKTGRPLDRVCFLGPNGTGKTTLLRLLGELCRGGSFAHTMVTFEDAAGRGCLPRRSQDGTWLKLEQQAPSAEIAETLRRDDIMRRAATQVAAPPWLTERASPPAFASLVIEVPSDTTLLLRNDPPRVPLRAAMPWIQDLPRDHVISPGNAEAFWTMLMTAIGRRAEQLESFLREPANQKRTVEDVLADFADRHADFLPQLAKQWSRLLEPCGLELDVANVKLPSQLDETLSAHVRSRATGAHLPYNALSSGLRAFLFRLGYLFALYFDREVPSGLLFIDEPELSLHPDFLYDIVDIYESIAKNTQMFVATHSPIVAAQFRPEERVILEFDDAGFVAATRGSAPEGDDPNHLLSQDFHVRSILGKKGLERWERYRAVHDQAMREADGEKRRELVAEYLRIGAEYGFDPAPSNDASAAVTGL